MIEKISPRGGEVRCLGCFERFYPPRGSVSFACPHCSIEWRISWATPEIPKIRGPVWDKLRRPRDGAQ